MAAAPRILPPLLQRLRQPLPVIPIRVPAAAAAAISGVTGILNDIWEGILRAVPKKKTSHMKKRHRQMAGKALKDVSALVKCSGCGRIKMAHVLCPHCSKQYLTLHTIPAAHPTDIFALAPTRTALLTASGSSSIRIYDTTSPDFLLAQTLENAHKLGCHHLVTSKDGKKAASAGFGGECKIWREEEGGENGKGEWREEGRIVEGNKAGELWAVALSEDGRYLASTTYDGRINVWDTSSPEKQKIRSYETKGSFGMCVDLSTDGRFTASGHENGSVYVFNNDTGRLLHSLPGLIKPVRAVKFSPASKLLAAAGDARTIAIYDVVSGEQVANFAGHAAWVMCLDWSDTGEYLLSSSFDGKAKIWSLESRTCVATHSQSEKTLWAAKWLPKTTRSEMFAVAGAERSVGIWREASGS
ncbi:WD40 repeat-like protein [Saccharata proteae CBS 121410]|uniref:WD40 repeat-like protein n=1 Tax=Saccharata proteae CBS 121410 TaxID=1314787 RepID=A0A9P4HQF0_9PEZI|nr:WD40 repeat-like protein [Saccharata proteae CBS 121410]